MSLHEEKINLLKKYYKKIEINNSFYIAGEIPFSKFLIFFLQRHYMYL